MRTRRCGTPRRSSPGPEMPPRWSATVDALSERFAGQLPERAFTAIRDALQTDRDGHEHDQALAAQADGVAAELAAIRRANRRLGDHGRRMARP